MSGSRLLWSALVVFGLLAIPFFCMSRSTLDHAYRKRAKSDIQMLVSALDDFASRNGNHYPAQLSEIFGKDANNNPYLVKFQMRMPHDGWGHDYAYEPPTEAHPRPRLFCLGADGQRGGSGNDADVDSDALDSAGR